VAGAEEVATATPAPEDGSCSEPVTDDVVGATKDTVPTLALAATVTDSLPNVISGAVPAVFSELVVSVVVTAATD